MQQERNKLAEWTTTRDKLMQRRAALSS
ncbi:MAG: hypothetical protein ACE5FI_19080 [Anaerolineales bacterium]